MEGQNVFQITKYFKTQKALQMNKRISILFVMLCMDFILYCVCTMYGEGILDFLHFIGIEMIVKTVEMFTIIYDVYVVYKLITNRTILERKGFNKFKNETEIAIIRKIMIQLYTALRCSIFALLVSEIKILITAGEVINFAAFITNPSYAIDIIAPYVIYFILLCNKEYDHLI